MSSNAMQSKETHPESDIFPPPPPSGLQSIQSSFRWTKQLVNRQKNHEDIVRKLEKSSSNADVFKQCLGTDADPVNIICMDGGGMKGYSHSAVLQELQEMMGLKDDILQFFDMACGTSVGGIAALMQGYHGTNRGFLKDSNFLLDKIRQDSFTKFSLWNLLKKGSLTTGEDRIAHILKEYYGDTELYNPGALKAFALCTARVEKGPKLEETYEPYVLRSYDLPDETTSDDSEGDLKFDGTNEILLWEAMAATSAAPVMTDRVNLKIDGGKKQQRVADGCLLSNAPVAIAISEARRLWPKRPLGVILSLGLEAAEDELCLRAVEAAKASHSPNVKYLRLTSPLDDFSPGETHPRKIKKMQETAVKHAKEHSEELIPILSSLRSSGSRRSKTAKFTTRRKSRMSAWVSRVSMKAGTKGRKRRSTMVAPAANGRPSHIVVGRHSLIDDDEDSSTNETFNVTDRSPSKGLEAFYNAASTDTELMKAMADFDDDTPALVAAQ